MMLNYKVKSPSISRDQCRTCFQYFPNNKNNKNIQSFIAFNGWIWYLKWCDANLLLLLLWLFLLLLHNFFRLHNRCNDDTNKSEIHCIPWYQFLHCLHIERNACLVSNTTWSPDKPMIMITTIIISSYWSYILSINDSLIILH